MKNLIEDKKNSLNLEIRGILTVIDLIDNQKRDYENYEENSLNENDYLDQQINLAKEAKERLIAIFKN